MAEGDERIVVAPDPRMCPHESLTPRWRGPQAMEEEGGAMGYVCHRCHAELSPNAARALAARAQVAGAGH